MVEVALLKMYARVWQALKVIDVNAVSSKIRSFFTNSSIVHSILAVCNLTCIHGACTKPYECSCEAGWNGTACDQRELNKG